MFTSTVVSICCSRHHDGVRWTCSLAVVQTWQNKVGIRSGAKSSSCDFVVKTELDDWCIFNTVCSSKFASLSSSYYVSYFTLVDKHREWLLSCHSNQTTAVGSVWRMWEQTDSYAPLASLCHSQGSNLESVMSPWQSESRTDWSGDESLINIDCFCGTDKIGIVFSMGMVKKKE